MKQFLYYVYVIEQPDGVVKFGRTGSLKRRVKKLPGIFKHSEPFKNKAISIYIEALLKARFKHAAVDGGGERVAIRWQEVVMALKYERVRYLQHPNR